MTGIVYLLTNPAMPNMVKIGKTTRENPSLRMNELYSTGVPLPFECRLAIRVENESTAEQALHIAFQPYRVNPSREFFEIDPEQAVAILRLLGTEDVTPDIKRANDAEVDIVSKEAVKNFIKRRPPLNYLEMGIPIGSTLVFIRTGETATVIADKKVLFRENETSLSQATKEITKLDYVIQPTPHWSYEGRTLQRIYDDTYERY